MTNSSWEDYFEQQLKEYRIPDAVKEFRFKPPRRFRFDFAWPTISFAVEIDGNVYNKSRHTTGVGYSRDCEKFALAAIDGWRIIRCTTGQVNSGEAIKWVKEYFVRQVNDTTNN